MTAKKDEHKAHAEAAKYLAEKNFKKRGRLTLGHVVKVAMKQGIPISTKNEADIRELLRRPRTFDGN